MESFLPIASMFALNVHQKPLARAKSAAEKIHCWHVGCYHLNRVTNIRYDRNFTDSKMFYGLHNDDVVAVDNFGQDFILFTRAGIKLRTP